LPRIYLQRRFLIFNKSGIFWLFSLGFEISAGTKAPATRCADDELVAQPHLGLADMGQRLDRPVDPLDPAGPDRAGRAAG
jgi:hypothetical protein